MAKKRTGFVSKAELAMAYRPDISLKSALQSLYRQLNETPGLMQALKDVGYKKNQKLFTPLQIEVIYEKIGAP